ncbi:hypothetical protein SODG_006244 [Sodalis praecaptivus]
MFREAINAFALQGRKLYPIILIATDSASARLPVAAITFMSPLVIRLPPAFVWSRSAAPLVHACRHDQIIIEDDYDSELNFAANPPTALKARDTHSRVIYVSSLSKSLSPGLRLVYLVAPAELVDELRALRRLAYRHPPTNIQHQMAYFLAQGYYETYLHRYREDSTRRWHSLDHALTCWLPECRRSEGSDHANAFWLQAPQGVSIPQLTWLAAHRGC